MRPFTVAYTGDFRGGGRAAHRRSGHRPARPAPVAALPVPRRPGAPPPGDDGYTDRLYHLEITADGVRSHNAIITRPGFAAKLQRYRENDARAIN